MLARTRRWLKRQHDQHKACVFETLAEGRTYMKTLDKKKLFKQCFARRWIGWWILLAAVTAVSILLSIYHDRMVNAVRPWAEKILSTPAAWLVPVVALIIVSIPPLAGAEPIILIVGVIWGLAWGFLIAIAGTWLGEILCFYLFKYFFREKAKKIEAKSPLYYNLAEIMRKDGLWMVSMVRFSAIPGHVTTAIQSCIGISIWVYGIAAAISLPKQLAIVYLGVLFGESHSLPAEQAADGGKYQAESNLKHTIVTWTVLCITGWATFMAFYVIWFRIWQLRKREAIAKAESDAASQASSTANGGGNGIVSEMMFRGDSVASSTLGLDSKSTYGIGTDGTYPPTLEYFTTASSGSRTPAPSYRELMPESLKNKSSSSTIGSIYNRPPNVRSRSSTLAGLAFSNNSLPYLPYTPMLDVPNQLPSSAGTRMPSPVPSAKMPSPGQDIDLERQAQGDSSAPTASNFSGADGDSAMRVRRVRLARSNSNLLLPAGDGDLSSRSSTPTYEHPSTGMRSPGRVRPRSRSSTLAISSLPNHSPDITVESSQPIFGLGLLDQTTVAPTPARQHPNIPESQSEHHGERTPCFEDGPGEISRPI